MIDSSITYFPVGNGDTTLIQLYDETSILIDCNITQDSEDENKEEAYPVHDHILKKILKDKNNIPYLDVFILTHPDEDHCRGFVTTFYTGDPSNYEEKDRKEGKIRIDELWLSPRMFSSCEEKGELSESAQCVYKEAERRMDLYKDNNSESKEPGNRLRVIGYSDNEELKGLENIIITPGNSINLINSNVKSDFSFFIHAPFKEDNDSELSSRNDTSIILQARFDVGNTKNAGLAFFGGDSKCTIFEKVVERSEKQDLQWDLFLAPHHCSWYFFNELSYEEDPTPSKKILDLLGMSREGAFIIASCKPIVDNDDNPPHFGAAKEYKKKVKENNFLATMEWTNEKNPTPINFRITQMGPQIVDHETNQSIVSSAAIRSVVRTPQTYGK
ncbi:hypothetical protein SDC9_107957 [bioreactor metagenome]|uniref:Metallohydrolase n=1 Tax=bioreactor metagenome TaxID=1076179 RepID=A0A645BD44_9ZZZZ